MTEEQVFLAALELPDATSRAAYLDERCAEDAGLRGQVEALLASHFKSGDFMDVPAPVQIDVEPSFDHAVTIQSDAMPVKNPPEPDFDGLRFLEPSSRPDSLGRIGHYEVLQVLGVGGFGIVLRAFDDVLERVVAVKVMAPQLATTSPARKRFLREARTSAQVRHDNVVQVYEVGEQPLPYLVMEFIPGETLQQRLDRIGPLDVPEVLRIGRQIAEGLAAAHAMDLIHRDIKPGNVLLEGGQLKVKITDFGLARAADDASMTQSGQIVGTPMYMAPEQVWGHTLDQRADLFSLGTVMYQMVSGRVPFRAPSSIAVLKRVAEDMPRNIREVIPETPQWLCDIIAKLHAKKPDDRYQSAREVADVLADCEEQLKVNSKLQDYSRIPHASATQRSGGSRTWAASAAALVLVPLIALAMTELAGVTHLFRGPLATPDPRKSAGNPTSVGVTKVEIPVPVASSEPLLAIAPFTDAYVQRIAALPAGEQVEEVRQELMRLNPGFDGKVEHKSEADVVTELRFLTDHVSDISPVRALTRLRSLSCSGSFVGLGQLSASALLPLKGLPLTHLDCRDSAAVSDLSALAEMKLTSLDCRATNVGDANVENLAGMKDLQWLSLWGTKVTDASLKELGGFKNLQHLSLQSTKVTDAGLQELAGLDKLVYLDLYGVSTVTDAGLAHLARFKALKHLDLRGPRVTDGGVDKLASALPALRITTWGRVIEPKVVLAPFTDADIQRIAAHPAAGQIEEVRQELKRLNPGFDGKLKHKIENGVVTELSVNTDAVEDIAPVRALAGLIYLDCRGTYPHKGKLSDLSPLKGMTISRLDCSSTQVADLTPLAGLPLTFLHFNHNPVSEITALKGMPLLELGLAETKVSDLSPLKGMKLQMLGAQLLPVTDLTPLAGMPLKGLDLYHTIGVTNLEPLRGMPLEGLNLQDVPVSDLSALKGMGSLRNLVLDGIALSDLTPLQGLKLTDLSIRNQQVSDLSPLKVMPLVRLGICGTGVTDLRPLQGMPLVEIRLTPQNITQGLEILRDIKTLNTIGIDSNQAWPAAEFWERLDQGEFGTSRASSVHDTWLKARALVSLDQHAAELAAKLKERLPGFEDALLRTIPGMAADRQAIMVAAWLRYRNPAFVGEVTHKIESGVLTSLEVPSPLVQDLTPLRALSGLRSFTGRTTLGYDNRSAHDAAVLRSLKTLETINGKPVAEFWKDAEAKQAEFQEWLKQVATLPAEQQVAAVVARLKQHNPGLDGTAGHKVEGGVVTELIFTPVTGQDIVADLSPVRALPGLTWLNLWSCVGLEDLEPLKDLKLTRLIIGSLTVSNQVRDVEPLKGMKLTELRLYHCQVQDLEPLKGMPLNTLWLFSAQVRDIEPLRGMPLTSLALDRCTQIKDFTPLAGMALTVLALGRCQFRDLELLHGMPLARLTLADSQAVQDLEPLKGMPLKELAVHNTGVTDLNPLQGMELEKVHLTPKNITQGLDILRDMQSLKTIGIDYNQVWPAADFWERLDKGEFK